MIAISTTELRKHLKKYLNLATREKVVVQFNKSETVEIVPGKKITVKDEAFDNTRLLEVLKRGVHSLNSGTEYLKQLFHNCWSFSENISKKARTQPANHLYRFCLYSSNTLQYRTQELPLWQQAH